MATTLETVTAVIAWVEAVLPEIPPERTYDFPSMSKPNALPDLAVQVTRTMTSSAPAPGGIQQLQQRRVDVHELMLAILTNPEPERASTHQLWDFADRLKASQRSDPTLGQRVMTSDDPVFSLDPPFAEWDDGTRGRLLTVDMAVRTAV